MKKFRFLALAMVALMTLNIVGCKDPDEDIPYESIEMSDGQFINIVHEETDACYPINFHVTMEGSYLKVNALPTKATQYGIDHGLSTLTDFSSKVFISSYGEAKSLIDVMYFPDPKTYADSASIVEEYGYIVKAYGSHGLNTYPSSFNVSDPDTVYMRIWLEEATETGFKVRYEFPFTPVVEEQK